MIAKEETFMNMEGTFKYYFKQHKNLKKAKLETLKKFVDEFNDNKNILDRNITTFNKFGDEIKKNIEILVEKTNELSVFFSNNFKFNLLNENFLGTNKTYELNYDQNCEDKYFQLYEKLLEHSLKLVDKNYKSPNFSPMYNGLNLHFKKIEDSGLIKLSKIKTGKNFYNFLKKNFDLKSKILKDKPIFPYWDFKGEITKQIYSSWWSDDLYEILHFYIPKRIEKNEIKKFNEDEKSFLSPVESQIRSILRKDHMEKNISYVYVLSNKSYGKDTFKIGSTSGIPEDRAVALSSTGLIHPFIVVYKQKFKNAEFFEKKVFHKILMKQRIKGNREFFKVDLPNLKKIFKIIKENELNLKDDVKLGKLLNKIQREINQILES